MDDWREIAKCKGVPVDGFYPERDSPTFLQDLQDAKDFCRGGAGEPCPTLHQCLVSALINDEKYGVWGGLSNRERRALWRKRRLPAWITREDLIEIGKIRERRLGNVAGQQEEADGAVGARRETLAQEEARPPQDGRPSPVGDVQV